MYQLFPIDTFMVNYYICVPPIYFLCNDLPSSIIGEDGKIPSAVKIWHYIDASSLLQKCQFCMLAMYNGQYHVENDQVLLWKILVLDHSDHGLWTPYMWSVPLNRGSPAFSVRDKYFQKVTNWSALVTEISLEQRNLWPFWLLPVA